MADGHYERGGLETPALFNYVTHSTEINFKYPWRVRVRVWFRRHRPQIRTLRSENFTLTLDKWWRRSDRESGRLSLALMESKAEEIRREMGRRFEEEAFFGTSFRRVTWEADAGQGETGSGS